MGADLDYETSEHKTAMHWAAEVGRLDSIGGLLKRGASVDRANALGMAVLVDPRLTPDIPSLMSAIEAKT